MTSEVQVLLRVARGLKELARVAGKRDGVRHAQQTFFRRAEEVTLEDDGTDW